MRDDGPQSHLTKAGTPTMGGALILSSIGVTTLLWADLTQPLRLGRAAGDARFGAIGWVDDYRKVDRTAIPKGLSEPLEVSSGSR